MSRITRHRVVKVITPRNNQRDVLACETFLSALVSADAGEIALELAGTPSEHMFLIRGNIPAVNIALAQLAAAYPQCDFEDVSPEDDPGRQCAGAQRVVELRLREAPYLPLRTALSREGRATYEDFAQAADPMVGVVAALDGLEEGEACLIQFALAPMPDDWAAYWRGSLRDVGERAKVTPQSLTAGVLAGLAAMSGIWAIVLLALTVGLGLPVGFALVALMMLMVSGSFLWTRLRMPSPPDPMLVRQKINLSAFRVRARVFVRSTDVLRSDARVAQIGAALRAYNLAGANGFRLQETQESDPQWLRVDEDHWWQLLPFLGSMWPARRLPVLNTTELASLWHLPHAAAGIQGIAYTSSRRVLPIPRDVSTGVLVGVSRAQGRSVEVRLSARSLRGNIGLVAKTQSGKSNLMALFAADILANDPQATVIVVDPHRSLAQKVAAMVPPGREAQTIYWSLADRTRPFGLNLIDRLPKGYEGETAFRALIGNAAMMGDFADKRVSDVIDAFNEIWPQNWGPRMEDYLRGPLLTMSLANEMLLRDFAFEEWLMNAGAAFAANELRVRRGRLDPLTTEMVRDTWQTFQQLQEPQRPMRVVLFRQLRRLYADYEKSHTTSASSETVVAAVKALRKALIGRAGQGFARDVDLGLRAYRAEDGTLRPLQYTLLDVNPMLTSRQMRMSALGALDPARDRHLMNWWRDSFDAELSAHARHLMEMVTPVRTKMNRFSASDIARRIFGQPESTINLHNLLDHGGVLIVDLAAGVIGQETSALVGSAILNWIASIIFARQDGGTEEQASQGAEESTSLTSALPHLRSSSPRKVFLVVDEFQSIPGADYAFMLSELGKYGVQMCLGTQSLGLLDELNRKTRRAWLDNTNALFVFRCGADDARDLAQELSVGDEDNLTITAADIVGLPEYSCFARVRGAAVPFRIDTRKVDEGDLQIFERIRESSRQKYGRDAALVDEWLALSGDLHGTPDLAQGAGAGYARPMPPVVMPEVEEREASESSQSGDFAASVEKETDEVS